MAKNIHHTQLDKTACAMLHINLALSEHKKDIHLYFSSKPTFDTFVRINQGVSNKIKKVMKRGGFRYKVLQL